ncbi:DnaJ-domain-containing protein [Aaosphaeria arxii CBS 175.79]|uniref:DnaJ-domain-containing protein n=1 Tax=Aaosphaeria arxii CBS 175.79 TaxID=1450172 RepID=A0A6A5XLX8_9PLEO|nr:DnaJ-domain-containing protein [Aaosphaeria arxii CBS 175.79]KAF2014245.1 DnaJ-domain-containing protein [Aaosphaeria arxii CBS 175.79]
MAPSAITEDYYQILEVDPTAELALIVRSYKRLALKLHPDRNPKRDATEAFQRLSKAYETLSNEDERRRYDLIYPSIKGKTAESSQHTTEQQYSNFARSPGPLSEATRVAAKVAAIHKSKHERATKWRVMNMTFESSIFELKRVIRRLEQEIKDLESILEAEAADEAYKNSWSAWLLAPIYKTAEDTEEEKDRKDRERQERRIEKDMKERRLYHQKAALATVETSMRTSKNEFDTADSRDDVEIQVLEKALQARMHRFRRERENAGREKLRQQQQEQWGESQREAAEAARRQREHREKWLRQAAEAARQQQAAMRTAQGLREEEYNIRWRRNNGEGKKRQQQSAISTSPQASRPQTHTTSCQHDGWWPKIQGHAECPRCNES